MGFTAVLATSADAQWTQGARGATWVKTAVYYQYSDEVYNPLGEKQPYLGNGEARNVGVV